MGYTNLSNLEPYDDTVHSSLDYTLTPPALDPALGSDVIFYHEDRIVLTLQRNSNGQKANTTIRKKMNCFKDGKSVNIFVEVGAIREFGSITYEFVDDQYNAALPCPPFDDVPGGTPSTP